MARSIQSNATVQVLPGLAGGCAKPIFDHAHEKSAKRQGDRGLMLRPLSSNLPYRSRREELRLRQRRKKSVWVRSVVRGRFLVAHQRQECDFGEWTTTCRVIRASNARVLSSPRAKAQQGRPSNPENRSRPRDELNSASAQTHQACRSPVRPLQLPGPALMRPRPCYEGAGKRRHIG